MEKSEKIPKFERSKRFFIKPLLKKFKDIFIEWCKSSTSHGIPNIARSENILLSLLWATAFLISTGFCGYYIILTIIDVSKDPIMINIEVEEELPAVFPTISFCNLNPFKTTDENVSSILKNYLRQNNVYYGIHPNLASITATTLAKSFVQNLPDEEKKNFGYQYSEMMMSCKFNSFPCSDTDFEWFYEFDYGNCYRFNGDGSKLAGKSGSRGGLRLELYIGNSSSNEAYTIKRGIRFLIHNHTDQKSISDHGQDASAGFSTEVKIQRNFYTKLSRSMSNCLEDLTSQSSVQSDMMKLMFNYFNFSKYTREMCMNLCFQKELEKNCSCSDPTIPQVQNLTRCVSSKQIMCLEIFFQRFYSKSQPECQTECPKECATFSFTTKLSSSEYFTNWYHDLFLKFKKLDKNNDTSALTTISSYSSAKVVRENALVVIFNYDDMEVTKVTEVQFWTVFSILSNIGGNLGLFVGISILSCIEILELICQFIIAAFSHFNQNKTQVLPYK